MRKRPAIPRLDGGPQTILLVDDVERSVEFYGQSLMLRQTDADPGRYAEFDTGDGCALVLLRREGSIAPIAVPSMTDQAVNLSFSITADGYEAWKKWFPKRGVPIERETKWIHGGRSLYVRDPDGRRLEFKSPPAIEPPAPVIMADKKRAE